MNLLVTFLSKFFKNNNNKYIWKTDSYWGCCWKRLKLKRAIKINWDFFFFKVEEKFGSGCDLRQFKLASVILQLRAPLNGCKMQASPPLFSFLTQTLLPRNSVPAACSFCWRSQRWQEDRNLINGFFNHSESIFFLFNYLPARFRAAKPIRTASFRFKKNQTNKQKKHNTKKNPTTPRNEAQPPTRAAKQANQNGFFKR